MVSVPWVLTFVSDTEGNFSFKIMSVNSLVKKHWPFLLANRSIILTVHEQNWKVTGSGRQAKQALLANIPIYFEGKE